MKRVSSVSGVTRKPVDPPSREKKNPPAATGGLSKLQTGTEETGDDFASALLMALQAHFRVKAVIEVERDILARRRRELPDLDITERGENRAIFREAFAVYRGTWPEPVRHYFERLTGFTYEAFEQALTVLGEALFADAPNPRSDFGSLITPEALGPEATDDE